MRLTEVLARLHVFAGEPPPIGVPGVLDDTPMGVLGLAVGCPPGSELAAALAGLGEASRASVLDPLGLSRPAPPAGRPARVMLPFLAHADAGAGGAPTAAAAPAAQVDETTCGSAVLSLLAMAGNPRLALHVARDPVRRFAALQHRIHRACARTGILPWPLRLGTTPWDAAAVARFGDRRYTHRVVGGPRGARVLRHAVRAASAGIPVPLFTGGDLRGGWQAAVPRHVVLLAAAESGKPGGRAGERVGGPAAVGDVVRIYEPSSATMHTVPTSLLLDPDAATERERALLTAALGWWPHVVWAVLPR